MKFLQIIDNSFIGRIVQGRLSILEHTDPDRIYVENIRSFYKLPYPVAKFLCEMAVKQHFFMKRVAIECPNEGRIIRIVSSKTNLPQCVKCDNCEALGKEKYEFSKGEYDVTEFYQLNRN